jgi:hypothetical protein
MNRPTIVVFILGLLFCTSGCCDKGKNRLDIALEGPWILHQTQLDDGHGNKIPVLVAIAPVDATAEDQPGMSIDPLHHHSPQLSTGDGFYIKEKYLKNARIFCVFFGTQCAPKGPDSLMNDSYPESKLLRLNHTGQGTWDWVTRTYGNNGVALILPMPDSFSDDGVWHIRFPGKGEMDGQRSIGIHLHYSHGPTDFTLRACNTTPPTPPTIADCNNKVAGAHDSEPTQLTNSGTLRIQMRAPDNTDPCDPHARYAWTEAFALLGSEFDSGYGKIDLAERIDANGVVEWGSDDYRCTSGGMKAMSGENPSLASNKVDKDPNSVDNDPYNTLSGKIQTLITQLETSDKDPAHKEGWASLEALKSELSTLNPSFPRISQLMLVGALSNSSTDLIRSLQVQAKATARMKSLSNGETLPETLDAVLAGLVLLDNDPDTKNGADCRAAVVSAQ